MAHGDGKYEKVESRHSDEEQYDLADFFHVFVSLVIFAFITHEILEEAVCDDGRQSTEYEAKDKIDLPGLDLELSP